MKRLLPLLAVVAILFTGCPDPRETVNFDTDPQVLRGSWNFIVSDAASSAIISTQAVTFTPTFVAENRYTVTASVTLEGEVYELAGDVYAENEKFVRPQYQPLPVAFFDLTRRTTTKTYSARITIRTIVVGRWTFIGDLSTVENNLTKRQRLEIIRN